MAGYYHYVDPDPALARLYGSLERAARNFERRGRVGDALQTRLVSRQLRSEIAVLGHRAPAKADEFIRARLRSTRVGRPDTSGQLSKAIRSSPMPTTLPAAAVNVASIDVLDQGAVNPRSGGIYWRAQEWGLPAVSPDAYTKGGRKVAPGYFMPGYSAPNNAEFRQHPYFQQFGYAKGVPALMRLRAVQPRHYLRDGTKEFIAWHAAKSQAIAAHLLKQLPRI